MDALRRVVVVGGASDTETVLKAVLEPRGTRVERARGRRGEACPAAHASPEVVVIDVDAEPDAMTSLWKQSCRVLIGSCQPDVISARERFLVKPFHFPELVKVIEDLLETNPAA